MSFAGGDRFEVLRRIGAGGMGVVYEAFDHLRASRVAIKTLDKPGPDMLYYLKREFRSLSGVVHPNLVTFYELISTDADWFITMQFIEGVHFLQHFRPREAKMSKVVTAESTVTIHAVVNPSRSSPTAAADRAESTPLEPQQYPALRDALRQLAEGVCALHESGMIHRDLKPSNVLVTPEGRVIVLDFGLVMELTPTPLAPARGSTTAGTAAYMAPEQSAGESLTEAADWYAVGVMLYQTLTGVLPPNQSGAAAPRDLAPDIPADLDQLCADLLERDPARRPPGLEILRRLGAHQQRRGHGEFFFGRVRQLDALRQAFAEVEAGRPCAIYLHGRSGMGKSALARKFLEEIAEREVVILAGRCYERESVPYKALDSVVDSLSRYLALLPRNEVEAVLPRNVHLLGLVFPVLYRVPAIAEAPQLRTETPSRRELRRRAFDALRELLARLSDRRKVCVFIDDLQWGDTDSAELLRGMLAPPDPPLLLFLGSYRTEYETTSPCLTGLLGRSLDQPADSCRKVEVGPLEEEEARNIALTLAGSDRELAARAGAIAGECGGNPYFLAELVHYAGSVGGQREAPGEARLENMLWNRTRGLPQSSRDLLELLAVAGHAVPERVAAHAAGLEGEAQQALTLLRGERLVRAGGSAGREEIEPFHDRLRESLITRLDPARRKDCHRRLALAIESCGDVDPELLAMHYQGAEENQTAARHYRAAAAQAAQALAFGHAADLYRLGLQLDPPDGAALTSLQTSLADALANAGRSFEAAQVYGEAAAHAPPSEVHDLERRCAYHYSISGRVEEGRAAFRRALGRIGMRLPETSGQVIGSYIWTRLRLAAHGLRFRQRSEDQLTPQQRNRADTTWSAGTGLGLIDVPNGAYFTSRALLVALQCGEPNRIARALAWEGATAAALGESGKRRARKLFDLCRRIVSEADSPFGRAILQFGEGVVAFSSCRFVEATDLLGSAEKLFSEECTGVTWELSTTRLFALFNLLYRGQWRDLAQRSPMLLAEASGRGDLYAAVSIGCDTQPVVHLVAGDPEAAERSIEEWLNRWSRSGFFQVHAYAANLGVWVELYRGDGEAALKILAHYWPDLKRNLYLRVDWWAVSFLAMRAQSAVSAALRAPDPAPLLKSAERDLKALERKSHPLARPLAATIHAGMASVKGDRAQAIFWLEKTVRQAQALGMDAAAAAAKRLLGRLSAAPELTAEAEAWMKQQGVADPDGVTRLMCPGFRDADVAGVRGL